MNQPYTAGNPQDPNQPVDEWGNPLPSEMIADPNNQKPQIPDYVPTWNNSFSVSNFMKPQLDGIPVDTSGLGAFSAEAKRSGPGAWAGLAQKQNEQMAANQRDQAERTSAGATAQAESNLAMHGGLDSGARERVALGGANQTASANQSIGNQEAQNSTNISMQDEKNRIGELEALPQVQNEYLQPQFQKAQLGEQAFATDVQGQENNVVAGNAYNMGKFGIQAQEYGADKQAAATAGQGGSSCWIISGLARHEKLPADQALHLTRMKYHFARQNPRLSLFYFKQCGELVVRMDRAGFDWREIGKMNESLMELLRAGECEAAGRLFFAKVLNLIDRFWPECSGRAYLQARQERTAKVAMAARATAPRGNRKFAIPCLENLPPECFQA